MKIFLLVYIESKIDKMFNIISVIDDFHKKQEKRFIFLIDHWYN